MHQFSYRRRLTPLITTRFLSSFNDAVFKICVVLSVCGINWDYFKDSAFILMMAGAMIFPYFILPIFSGFLADHMQKRYVMMITRLIEIILMLTGTLALSYFDVWGIIPLLIILFLISCNSAIFSPAFDANLPELFPETELSRATGSLTSIKFFAILIAIAIAPVVWTTANGDAWFYGAFFVCIGIINFFATARIVPQITPIQAKKELSYKFKETLPRVFNEYKNSSGLLLTALGDAFFISIAVSMLPLLVLFGKYTLDLTSAADISILQLAPVFGLCIGVFLAGRFSGKKIELGLIPLGALGMALFLPLGVYLPGRISHIAVTIPDTFINNVIHLSFNVYPYAILFLVLTGLSGGLFLIPLRAFLQQRSTPELRGAVIATKNALAFLFGAVGTSFTVLLALGGCQAVEEIPKILRDIGAIMPDYSPQSLLVLLGATTLVLTIFSMWLLPNFMLRFIILALGNSLYKTRIIGAENIPERGPALLISNHVSVIDSVLISACTSRQIRFLLHEDYYTIPWLRFIARLTGFFKVPSSEKSKSMKLMFDEVQEFIRNGGIVCVFPEGKISRNGLMSRFKKGYKKMLPEDIDIPIIPVNISYVWGSVFSHFFGKIKLRLPRQMPYYSAVSFGKPMPSKTSSFEIRQKICELSAEAGMHPHPSEKTLHMALAQVAKRHPFRTLMLDFNGKSYTAFQAHMTAVALSFKIRKLVATDCKCVGILLPNGTEEALSILGILMADKIAAPLNYSVSQETFDISLDKADISCIITSRVFLEKVRFEKSDKMIFIEDILTPIPVWQKFAITLGVFTLPCSEFMNIVSPLTYNNLSQTAAILFSSGSTGIPKGIMLSHHNFSSDVRAIANAYLINQKDVVLGNLPLFHSFGINVCLWMPILEGFKVVYVPSPLDANNVCDAIAKNKVSLLFSTPSFLQKYMQRAKEGQFDSVRVTGTGAEKLRKDISERYHSLTQDREIVELYGCTELAPVVTINVPEDTQVVGKERGKFDSIGMPLENMCIRILDPLTFEPVDHDEEGLLFVKGPIVMQGYIKDHELTQKAIRNGYYNTGDIAKMDEAGYINICGRLSRFSKIAGEMVPHEMVEAIINEMCACDMRVVAVGGMPDPTKGEVLLVLYTDDMPLTPEEIVDQLRERSISNLWIPKVANFQKVESLPLLGSGKLDLSMLRVVAEKLAAERAQTKA